MGGGRAAVASLRRTVRHGRGDGRLLLLLDGRGGGVVLVQVQQLLHHGAPQTNNRTANHHVSREQPGEDLCVVQGGLARPAAAAVLPTCTAVSAEATASALPLITTRPFSLTTTSSSTEGVESAPHPSPPLPRSSCWVLPPIYLPIRLHQVASSSLVELDLGAALLCDLPGRRPVLARHALHLRLGHRHLPTTRIMHSQ